MMTCCSQAERRRSVNSKQCFILALAQANVANGFETTPRTGVDGLIVDNELSMSEVEPINLLGEVTDLLVLLLYHVKPHPSYVSMVSQSAKVAAVKIWDVSAKAAPVRVPLVHMFVKTFCLHTYTQ